MSALSIKEWTCSHCHAVHDRNVNAANNLKNRSQIDFKANFHQNIENQVYDTQFKNLSLMCDLGLELKTKADLYFQKVLNKNRLKAIKAQCWNNFKELDLKNISRKEKPVKHFGRISIIQNSGHGDLTEEIECVNGQGMSIQSLENNLSCSMKNLKNRTFQGANRDVRKMKKVSQ